MDATNAWKRKNLRFKNFDTGASIGKSLLFLDKEPDPVALHLIESLIRFCRILVGILTVLERIGDIIVSW